MKINTLFPKETLEVLTGRAPRWDSVKRSAWRVLGTFVLGMLLNVFIFLPTYAQLQQSGGVVHVIVDTTSTTAVTQATGTNLHAVIDTGSTTAVTQATGTNLHAVIDSGAITTTLGTGSNVIGYVRTEPLTSCGSTIVDSALTVIPATTTAITGMGSTATCMDKIYLDNTLGTAATCNVTDVTGPTSYVTSFSIPGNSNLLLLFGGIKFAGGAKWFCPTGTVNGQALGYQ
jgi:hypothetical protein